MPGSAEHNLSDTRRRRVVGAVAGAAAVEWYEFFTFGLAAALVFGPEFFPATNAAAGVMASFATFAVGFLARPIGGLVAGNLGDKYGRKPMLVGALVLMGIATGCIGLLPGYATIGVAAPLLLVVLRILQGLSMGALWGGASLLATEHAPENKRGVYGSLITLGAPIGSLVAQGVALLASKLAPGAAFLQWGWRVPFLVGFLTIALAYYVHRVVEESPDSRAVIAARASAEQEAESPIGMVLRHHLGTVVLAGCATLLISAGTYITANGLLDYTTRVLHVSRDTMLGIFLVNSFIALFFVPAAAALSDRVGRFKVFAAGVVAVALVAVPMLLLIDTAQGGLIATAIIGYSILSTLMSGPHTALMTELFDPEVRYTAASMGYQVSSALAGGLSPLAMVALLEATGNNSLSIAGLIIALALVTLGSVLILAKRARARSAQTTAGHSIAGPPPPTPIAG
ncbi:MFS transporter [Planotetraspora sp. GP83]|uniref:MFS transporter n=1 Tax=Planotetraspora sp. GP83 TaxID=3156264 RepID=UPI00351515B4